MRSLLFNFNNTIAEFKSSLKKKKYVYITLMCNTLHNTGNSLFKSAFNFGLVFVVWGGGVFFLQKMVFGFGLMACNLNRLGLPIRTQPKKFCSDTRKKRRVSSNNLELFFLVDRTDF